MRNDWPDQRRVASEEAYVLYLCVCVALHGNSDKIVPPRGIMQHLLCVMAFHSAENKIVFFP